VIHNDREWWRDAVVYQVYPRSFTDSTGDGVGDIPGLIRRLDYLRTLSIDAIWISPFYPSPLHDGGYDVADYRDVDSRLGTLADVDTLIEQAHARQMRIVLDIVPNHTSSEHPWFQEVLTSEPGSAAWDRYMIRTGKGPDHAEPPNNWKSVFHGPGWSRLGRDDGSLTDHWYLHLFDSTQPDLNWRNPEVRAEFEDILRFWFDRGVDGFRIDVANGLDKADGLPDYTLDASSPLELDAAAWAPFWDQEGVHEIYRGWRAVADSYDPPRAFCGEAWVPDYERLARYLRADELHTSFNFEFLKAGWDATAMRTCIDNTLTMHRDVGASPTWVLSNHDVVRHASRLDPTDAERGLRRARAATVFTLALPGSIYIYQGEELGLPEVHDLPDHTRQDPVWFRSEGTDVGRDGCRVPIPWAGDHPSYGFGPSQNSWLPQPSQWAKFSVAAQDGTPGSTLELYRAALGLRRTLPTLGDGPMVWLPSETGVLAVRRIHEDGDTLVAVLNINDHPVHLPPEFGSTVVLGSGDDVAVLETDDGEVTVALGAETAVWLTA
jgi:alpha-glucosidase